MLVWVRRARALATYTMLKLSRSYSRPKFTSSHVIDRFRLSMAWPSLPSANLSANTASCTSRPLMVVKVDRSEMRSPATNPKR